MENSRANHWEKIYAKKTPKQVSWTQKTPQLSLDLIHALTLPKDAPIIDIGGGESHLIDHLLKHGYTNLSVLDIAGNALNRSKKRLGKKASNIHWIKEDITKFCPTQTYEVWHDRAVFHFLTLTNEIEYYKNLIQKHITHSFIIQAFSKNGPLKCSGLPVKQYNISDLDKEFKGQGRMIDSGKITHLTPFQTEQDFAYACFKVN